MTLSTKNCSPVDSVSGGFGAFACTSSAHCCSITHVGSVREVKKMPPVWLTPPPCGDSGLSRISLCSMGVPMSATNPAACA